MVRTCCRFKLCDGTSTITDEAKNSFYCSICLEENPSVKKNLQLSLRRIMTGNKSLCVWLFKLFKCALDNSPFSENFSPVQEAEARKTIKADYMTKLREEMVEVEEIELYVIGVKTLDCPWLLSTLNWIVDVESVRLDSPSYEREVKLNFPELCSLRGVWLKLKPDVSTYFEIEKSRHSSFLALHGSPIWNWHNIIKTGLKNMSGTKFQAHGAVHGNGIYSTLDYAIAVSHCDIVPEGELKGKRGIAIVEVVDSCLLRLGKVFLSQDERLVSLRYVFVF